MAILLSCALGVGLYATTLSFDFARDDHELIANNAALQGGQPLGVLLLSDFVAASAGQSGKWRPAVTLVNWLDGRSGGWSARVFHRTNVLAYVLACGLLALLLTQVGLGRAGAVAGGLLFAAMPAHVESTAWISGRTDLLALVFVLCAAVLDHSRWQAGARSAGIGALACFACALLSKEVALAFVPVVATWQWVRGRARHADARSVLRWTIPYAAMAIAWAAAWLAVVSLPEAASAASIDVAHGRRQAIAMLPALLAFAFPWTLRAPDLLPPAAELSAVLLGAAFHALVMAGLWLGLVRRSGVATALAWLWFPLLVPILFGLWRGEVFFSERLIALTSIGVAWFAGMLVHGVEGRRLRNHVWAMVAAVIAFSCVQSWRYVPVWRNDAHLFAAVVERQPRNPIGHLGLAGVSLQEGRVEDALAHIGTAEALQPDVPEIHQYRAEIAFSRGEWSAVVLHAGRTLDIDPGRAYPRILRAAARVRAGSLDTAEPELIELVQMRGRDPLVAVAWGEWLLQRERGAEAEPYLRFVAAGRPGDARAHYLHGVSLLAIGRAGEARRAFERTASLDPASYDAWLRLAVLYDAEGLRSERDAALDRAGALPQSADGRVEALRSRFATVTP